MQDTYHVDHTSPYRRKHRRRVIVTLVVLLLLISGFVWLKQNFTSDTVINQSQPYNTTVTIPTAKLKTFSETTFEIGLPTHWVSQPTALEGADYRWQGTAKGETARSLEIFVDNIPSDMAVNRMLPVRGDGDSVLPTDTVSDNCINFTDANTANPHTGAANSKWSGVNFLCDTANTARVVVGTSSAEAINSVTATGEKGSHRYFFVYTDHSAQPNFEIFTQILSSFKAL